MTQLDELKSMLDLLVLDDYHFSVSKEGNKYELIANVNDVFCPAADGEVIPPDCYEEVIKLFMDSEQKQWASADFDKAYDRVIDWIGKRRGQTPYAWRSKH